MVAGRRLAAIIFTDIADYTSLSQSDEKSALLAVREQEGLVRPLLRAWHGRRVKSTGDGLLLEFPDALEAVECSVELQRRVRERNALGKRPRFELRIGIHLGDVQGEGADVLGDTVNIAARVLPLAIPGEVCLTSQVHDQVQNKVALRFEELGQRTLKGVRKPVSVFRVVQEGSAVPAPADRPALPRIAVLPLANISPDPKDEYFADGLTEELISALSRIQGLQVIARTSVLPYKANPKPVAQIGSELGVTSVLEGSVRKSGDHLRISVQLIDAGTQGHTWSSSYDRTLDDIFAVQSDIAERTAEALKGRLSGAVALPARAASAHPRAYELYLQGLVGARDLSEGAFETVAACFEQATRIDPAFAEAYAAWANLYVTGAGDAFSVHDVMPKAKALARKALELDDRSAEGHAALANIAMQFDLDWELAEREFGRALELNPSNVTALRFQSMLFSMLGRFDEARTALSTAIALDPEGSYHGSLAWVELQSGAYDRAIRYGRESVAAHPESLAARISLGFLYVHAGRLPDARRIADVPLPPEAEAGERFDHALLRAAVGHPEEARQVLAEIAGGRFTTYISPCYLAMVYAAIGERERAFAALEQDFHAGDRLLWLGHRSAFFRSIRDDPRFAEILSRYHLPPGATRSVTPTEPPRPKRAAGPPRAGAARRR